MMEFNSIDWADSNIEKIEIEYDSIKLYVFNDALQRNVCGICTGFIGLTNLCIWDDTIVENIYVKNADQSSDSYLQNVFSNYDKDFDCWKIGHIAGLIYFNPKYNGQRFENCYEYDRNNSYSAAMLEDIERNLCDFAGISSSSASKYISAAAVLANIHDDFKNRRQHIDQQGFKGK